MDYHSIWEDCINKLEDLGFDIDNVSDEILPKLPLSEDSIVGPIVVDAMCDIERMEGILEGGSIMSIEYTADDYLKFAIQRGYLSDGSDETFNTLMAITFIMDELQMDRMLFYRRSHAKQSILSPNRNIPALQLRTKELASIVDAPAETQEESLKNVMNFCQKFNPRLLEQSEYTDEDYEKLEKYNQFCESLYHNKKIMMLQRLDVTIQSLLWNQPYTYDTSKVVELRNEINITHVFAVQDVFDSRRSLLNRVFKVSMAMYKNKGSFRSSRIGHVPDRGGRITDDKCEGKRIIPKFKMGRNSSNKSITKSGSHSDKGEFNEAQKVMSVFGSAVQNGEKVVASNK